MCFVSLITRIFSVLTLLFEKRMYSVFMFASSISFLMCEEVLSVPITEAINGKASNDFKLEITLPAPPNLLSILFTDNL